MKKIFIFLLLLTLALAHENPKKVEKQIPLQNEEFVEVSIEFGAGHLDIAPTKEPVIYSGTFIYDELEPQIKYSQLGSEGRLDFELGERVEKGEDQTKVTLHSLDDIHKNEWNLNFSQLLTYDFDIEMGAAESEFNLGGLKIRNLRLECGASKTLIDFSKPNPIVMDKLKIETGVSKFGAENLLNANFKEMRFEGGIGDYQLTFDGELEENTDVFIDVSLGALTIHIPSDVPFRIDCDKSILSSLNVEGAYQKNERWYSVNFDGKDPFIDFTISSGVGSISILLSEQ